MSSLLSIRELCKSYGSKTILHNIQLSINAKERLALIGANGVGKTTLLRLLLGLEEPDSGAILCAPDTLIGYLPQQVQSGDNALSVREFAMQALPGMLELERELKELEKRMAQSHVEIEPLLEHYGQLQQVYERRQGYDYDSRLQEMMEGLGLSKLTLDSTTANLSGGECTRLCLAGLLVQQPDLLVLDEPTNHIDQQALDWLEQLLSTYPHAILLVSHDRRFLDKTVHALIELDPSSQQLERFSGTYSDYLKGKQRRSVRRQQAYEDYVSETRRLRRVIKEQTSSKAKAGKLKDNNKMAYDRRGERHQQSESRTIAQARGRLEELEAHPVQRPSKRTVVGLRFQPVSLNGEYALQGNNISLQFGDRVLFSGWTATVRPGERICLVGSNGCGKTSLLRVLAGEISPNSGYVQRTPSARLGFLTQHGQQLNCYQTVLEAYGVYAEGDESQLRAELAKYGLFGDEQVHKQIGQLSLGQRQKLQLGQLIASRANVLLLDEPTNHLDLTTMEALEQALVNFSGAIIAVTHDRWFIEQVATQVWNLEELAAQEESC